VLQLTGKSCPLDAGFRVLLQDRIDAVNSRAERNAA
jgi:hypothetical protein